MADHDQLTSQQLANIFGVSLGTIHNWVKRRRLPHHRTLGGQLRFDPYKVRTFLQDADHSVPDGIVDLTNKPWLN